MHQNTIPRLALTCLFLATLATQSCTKSEVEEIEATEATAASVPVTELKQFLSRTTGASIDKVVFADNTFTIGGDVTMTLTEASEHYNFEASGMDLPTGNSDVSQRKSFYAISRSKATTIKLYAGGTVPAAWITALDQAIANWNSVNSLLKISRTTSSTANITVTTNYKKSEVIASAVYPDSKGNPGKSIVINTYHNGLDASLKQFAITHELGHNFGFTHTDGTYGDLIPGTPLKDSYSVMNAVCKSWTGFSVYDIKAVQTVYPK
jgi:hypothetical protein